MILEAYDIKRDKLAEWQTTLDDFYEKVKGGHWVSVKRTSYNEVLHKEVYSTSDRRKSQHREHCNCCGNPLLKTLFPILADGILYWVGSECLEQLLKRGLHSSPDAIEAEASKAYEKAMSIVEKKEGEEMK